MYIILIKRNISKFGTTPFHCKQLGWGSNLKKEMNLQAQVSIDVKKEVFYCCNCKDKVGKLWWREGKLHQVRVTIEKGVLSVHKNNDMINQLTEKVVSALMQPWNIILLVYFIDFSQRKDSKNQENS